MARLPRKGPKGIPQHVIQRGNNRQLCFASEQDFACYAHWLEEYSMKFEVDIHAWVFMTNHVHLLATPNKDGAISLLMQALGRRYVGYFNREYRRSGTLWEGRFKSSLVQTEMYLLQCQRYIELNPVRANMVDDPGDYRWSSYQINALGKLSSLCTHHREYLLLGRDKQERIETYRSLFLAHVDTTLNTEIEKSLNRGLVLGSDRFKDEMELLLGQGVRPKKMGRPRKRDIEFV